ncbi:glyoxalase [Moraxella caviae]|uniref:Glyoxalase n=1 Tax=Moraxella caviae TaxID=34060 RepID=A0A1T0A0Y0_9GAMM|nr:VOC family protein [Moraxella caviae]OOR88861.1 glyoxalase [Moraxella caviae]STZ10225.1 Virulence protein STM3117 [Moraxella caviae]
MKIKALDHLVLTVADMSATIEFYTKVLGMQLQTFGDNRHALHFGAQKINLHQKGAEILPNAKRATCGSADLCLLTDTPLPEVLRYLQACGVAVVHDDDGEFIVPRTGAMGKIRSIYVRDPDGNLLEISRYE